MGGEPTNRFGSPPILHSDPLRPLRPLRLLRPSPTPPRCPLLTLSQILLR